MTAKRFLYRKLCCSWWCRDLQVPAELAELGKCFGGGRGRPASRTSAFGASGDRAFLELLGSTDAEAADWRERLAVESTLQARARRRR